MSRASGNTFPPLPLTSSLSSTSSTPTHGPTHKNTSNLQIILLCAILGGLFIISLFGLGGFMYIRRKKRRTMRIRGREEEADSPQKPEDKGYRYALEDNERQRQPIQGDASDSHFPRPQRRPSDVSLLHNGHTSSISSVSGSDLNLGSASKIYTTEGELSDSTITPRATPIPTKHNLSTIHAAIKIHVTQEQEQHPDIDIEIRPGSSESMPTSSALTDPSLLIPSSRLHFDLQRAESPRWTPNPPANSITINDSTTLPKPQYLDYFVASPAGDVYASPRKRLFSRFSTLSSNSSKATFMSTLVASSSETSSGNEGRKVTLNQNHTNDEQNVEEGYECDSMLHAHSRSNSYYLPSGQEVEEERSLSVARFSPDSSVRTIYAI